MAMMEIPASIELELLMRFREAMAGKPDKPSILAAVDWREELEARIAALERGLGLSASKLN